MRVPKSRIPDGKVSHGRDTPECPFWLACLVFYLSCRWSVSRCEPESVSPRKIVPLLQSCLNPTARGRGRLDITFVIRNMSVEKFCSPPLANFIFYLMIRTCCPTLNLILATRTRRRSLASIFFHIARISESSHARAPCRSSSEPCHCRPDKFWENVDILEGTFICKIFVYSVTNRVLHAFQDNAFHVGVFAHLQLYTLVA